jgi:AraC-like DNA-binding protein
MTPRALTAFALESAIGAELLIFALFLVSRSRRNAVLYVLTGLTLVLAAMIVANLAIGVGAWPRLSNDVLFADLLAPALIYLYVRLVGSDGRDLMPRDAAHAIPAMVGLGLWVSGLVRSMDIYVIGVWAIYLSITAYRFYRGLGAYGPAPLRHFITALIGTFGGTIALRVVMATQAGRGPPFSQGLPYLLVLVATFLVTSSLILTSLRYPGILISPPGRGKNWTLSEAELGPLSVQLGALIRDRRPYLDPDFNLAGLASMLNVSPRHISQLVNQTFGLNVSAYLNRCRVEEAVRRLALVSQAPIKVLMFESGFRSKSIFNREFRRCVGMSPTTFRRNLPGSDPNAG